MAEISAAAVKALRERTGLPMMDCKRALQECAGDAEAAIEKLRKEGKKTMATRAGRETSFGLIAVQADLTGPGAATPEELMAQPSPGKSGEMLKDQFESLNHRIREVFRLQRIVRVDGTCGGYAHHSGGVGVLLEVEGGNAELAKDICMHIAAMRPTVVTREELDPKEVDKERDILSEAARAEGKPEKIIAKMVEGRLKDFYAERCLLEQQHANKEKYGTKTIAQLAQDAGMKVLKFIHWELGKE